ncbi:hypothetical protein [Faecalibacter bovis]|uniref:Uncharacterized protein n=1 Tax=Faecalibacter bovis TaxID=2898187 RepID=A0ABX7XDU3_9FLAO|nr:hypothetical protein [Faecalibacter bovis]QTV06052.1 hypothetical protein J9309_01505 [Faecalibacter bovis]
MKDQAQKIFSHSSYKELWANPSGEFFSSENLAKLSLKADEKLVHFKRDEIAEESILNYNASIAIAGIDLISDALELNSLLEQEKEGKKRKTVIEALEKRISELNAPKINPVQKDDSSFEGIQTDINPDEEKTENQYNPELDEQS